ncbi:GGDEF domain-containing protein [uncultured Desulfosarcina sp.]|uniref:GGDEF domain-containing protein n=1 Tax=uncultured Desulfosarcina sp. TaxID=218289 RepID=UPI0029C75323|nr:GGDEF domain-containing protein [uncultured Desulfosarcina sp.]
MNSNRMGKTATHVSGRTVGNTRRIRIEKRFDADTEDAYRDFKFDDSRKVVVHVTFAAFFLIIGLWIWDWTVDPPHAMDVLPIRLIEGMVALCYPFAIVAGMRRKLLPWVLALVCLSMEGLYLYHLTLLDSGLACGLTGFMFWFIILIFAGLSFSLMPTMLTMIGVALLPNIVVACGMAVQMPLAQYNALIWPTCLIAMFSNLSLDRLYRRLFIYQRNIEHTARTDALTGIANRFHFNETAPILLELCRRHEHPLSVLMVDIDHFKKINDEYGHIEGDKVIRHVVGCMRAKLRRTDLLARYGGEEFVVILPETPPSGAMEAAEIIRRKIADASIEIGSDRSIGVTVSVAAGYNVLPDEIGLEELLRLADDALYKAKEGGRNRVVTAPGCLGAYVRSGTVRANQF